MQKLAKREEQIMQVLWNRGPSFVKEIVEDFPDPAPHYNTVSTMVRILAKKGFIDHKAYGKSHQTDFKQKLILGLAYFELKDVNKAIFYFLESLDMKKDRHSWIEGDV